MLGPSQIIATPHKHLTWLCYSHTRSPGTIHCWYSHTRVRGEGSNTSQAVSIDCLSQQGVGAEGVEQTGVYSESANLCVYRCRPDSVSQ